MKTMLTLSVLGLLALQGCACSGVEGVVLFGGAPAEGARVSLGELTTVTDAQGEFSFDSSPDGAEILSADLSLEDGRFVAVHNDFDIRSGTQEITLELPPPIELSYKKLTAGTVTLQWTKATIPNFDAYRVYRAPLAGLPPALIHVGRDIEDVTYFDDGDGLDLQLPTSTDFYYSVIASDLVGPIGGSNLLKVRIPPWNATTFAKRYRLEEISKFTADAHVGGMCWDGTALRIAYWKKPSESPDARNVWITRFDLATGTTSGRIGWNEDSAWPHGIACDSQGVWVNYNAHGAARIEQRDGTTGVILRKIAGNEGYSDVDFNGRNLFLAHMWNRVDVLERGGTGIIKQYETPFDINTLRGIALRNGEIWLAGASFNQLAILDLNDGTHIGVVDTGISSVEWNGFHGLFMRFVGENLVFTMNDKIRVFRIVAQE